MRRDATGLSRFLRTKGLSLIVSGYVLSGRVFRHCVCRGRRLLLTIPGGCSMGAELRGCRVPVRRVQGKRFHSSRVPSIPLGGFRGRPFVVLHSSGSANGHTLAVYRRGRFSPSMMFHLSRRVATCGVTYLKVNVAFVKSLLLSEIPAGSRLIFCGLPNRDDGHAIFFC